MFLLFLLTCCLLQSKYACSLLQYCTDAHWCAHRYHLANTVEWLYVVVMSGSVVATHPVPHPDAHILQCTLQPNCHICHCCVFVCWFNTLKQIKKFVTSIGVVLMLSFVFFSETAKENQATAFINCLQRSPLEFDAVVAKNLSEMKIYHA